MTNPAVGDRVLGEVIRRGEHRTALDQGRLERERHLVGEADRASSASVNELTLAVDQVRAVREAEV